MYLARRIGWEGEDFWKRFRLVRNDLIDPYWGPVPNPALPVLLKELKKQGIHVVLCSNAQETNCIELLDYLGFDDSCFEELCFDADKPHTFPQRIAQWGRQFNLSPKEMLLSVTRAILTCMPAKHAALQPSLFLHGMQRMQNCGITGYRRQRKWRHIYGSFV